MVFMSVKFRGKWIKLKALRVCMGNKRTKTSKYLLKAQLFSGDAENIR